MMVGAKHIFACIQNGVLLRTVLDGVTGDMSDTRTRYLGSRPVKLFRIIMQGNESVGGDVILFWLLYVMMKCWFCFNLSLMSYESI